MTKREYHKLINKKFYIYVEQAFPQYTLDFGEPGGRVILHGPAGRGDVIMYHQSEHYVMTYNYALNYTQDNCALMERRLNHSIIPEVEIIYSHVNRSPLN